MNIDVIRQYSKSVEVFQALNVGVIWSSRCEAGGTLLLDPAFIKNLCYVHGDYQSSFNIKIDALAKKNVLLPCSLHDAGNCSGNTCYSIMDRWMIKGAGICGSRDMLSFKNAPYKLYDAVVEIAHSIALGEIMPVGVVRPIALATINNSSCASSGGFNTPLAITVHEAFASFGVLGNSDDAERLIDDEARKSHNLDGIYNDLEAFVGGRDALIRSVGKYLMNSANQMAFAKLFGIIHGSLAKSNVTFDGRWHNLHNSKLGITSSGTACMPSREFLDEPELALQVAEQFMSNHGDKTGRPFNFEPLREYFVTQFDDCFLFHFPLLFGLDHQDTKLFEEDLVLGVYNDIVRLIHGERVAVANGYMDSVSSYLYDSLRGVMASLVTSIALSKSQEGVLALYKQAYAETVHYRFPVFERFCVFAVIRSLRRTFFGDFFRLVGLRDQVLGIADAGLNTILDTSIESCRLVAAWLFGKLDDGDEVIVFTGGDVTVKYKANTDCLLIVHERPYLGASPIGCAEMSEFVKHNERLFIVNGYNFCQHLISLLEIISPAIGRCSGLGK